MWSLGQGSYVGSARVKKECQVSRQDSSHNRTRKLANLGAWERGPPLVKVQFQKKKPGNTQYGSDPPSDEKLHNGELVRMPEETKSEKAETHNNTAK